jgi:hypothetical protein
MGKLRGQESFLRTAEEGMRMLRAVSDLRKIKVVSKRYKKAKGYAYHGVLFGHTLISSRLPEHEADIVAAKLADALKSCQEELARLATEAVRGSMLALSEEKTPQEADRPVIPDLEEERKITQ